jgi:hypothetical protein
MAGVSVNRWSRYGKDRLYVMDGELRLGWYDLVTDELHVEDAARGEEVRAAVAGHDATAGRTGVTTAADAVEEAEPATVVRAPELADPSAGVGGPVAVVPVLEPPDDLVIGDLAGHRPGQLARARAEQERAAQLAARPIRGRLARLLDAKTDERAWRIGADGEENTGGRLEKLTGKGWRVLHSIPVGERGSDIDHVLIGAGGVWTINTKRHPAAKVWLAPAQIRVNGQPVPYLRNSRFEATRAADLLARAVGWDPPVRPAIVLQLGLLADAITVKGSPEDVDVLDARSVPRWFTKRPTVLTSEQVEVLYAAARDPRTWTAGRAR